MTKYRFAVADGSRVSRAALLAGAAAIAVLLLSAGPAHAAAPYDPTHVTEHMKVRFGDLDLSTAKGAQQLYMRLRNAAEAVCGEYDPLDLYDMQGTRKCQDAAMENAVAQVNRPLLTAVYDHHHPHHA